MTGRFLVLIALFAPGCSAEWYPGAEADRSPAAFAPAELSLAEKQPVPADSDEKSLPTEASFQRKIIYTAEIDLVVEQFGPIPDEVEGLAKRFGGFVASSKVSGSPGRPRSGEWELRVPVERYEEFVAAARQLGEVHRVSVDSQDVTEEFYDVEARIRNKKKTEERLLDLLEEAAGELEQILTVERELSRVREEIERVEGRLRVLKDLTSLTTINLSITEVKDYVPEEAPSYTTRVRRGFRASLAALVSTAQSLSIAVIVLLPWLAVLLVVVILLVLLWRIVRACWPRSTLVVAERVEEPPSAG